jgi:hypothetical protein
LEQTWHLIKKQFSGIFLKNNFKSARQTAVTSHAINVTIPTRKNLYRVFGALWLQHVSPGVALGNSTP